MTTDDQHVPSDEDMRWHYVVKRMDDGATRTHAEREYTRWLAAHDARVRRDAEAELDSWMTRAYEAEKRAWQAEARIKHLEDTARVLVKEALNAEAERDSARGYISELETAVQSRNDVIKHRDARIKAVRDVLDSYDNIRRYLSDPVINTCSEIRSALEGKN